MDISKITNKYLQEVSSYFVDENSSEMSYRTPFQNFLKEIFPTEQNYRIQHDSKAISGNKPDFIVLKHEIPILYIEVKKVGEDLDKIEKSSQATRYFGYDNLIISDYLSFRFYRRGIRYDEPIVLGTPNTVLKTITPNQNNQERLIQTILDFTHSHKEPIKSGKHLAKIMGGKARRIRDNTIDFLNSEKADNGELKKIMDVIKQHLVSDIDVNSFADMYAQTLVYGLFAARYNDKTSDTFTRQEARELVPATNPFLQHFFDHIAGINFPKRLDTIVAELCEAFSHADVKSLMQEYFKKTNLWGKTYESPDPVIHFYEDFLQEYDPSKKMEMGVFYTPLPAVRFIIRGVDSILKNEFGITRGLADNQKIMVEKKELNEKGKEIAVQKEYAKVQILDVATGTGTFLNEVIRHIYNDFRGQEGRWPAYVQESLIPRLHGFELMMASYTIAHLKLGMTLQETGVDELNGRLGVYLTNTLDDAIDYSNQGSLFGFLDSIADESKSASRIKKEYPIMVVIGNPPYSGISQNKHYTENTAYKVEPGGLIKLQEKKNWLDDDYVKFIRFAESLVEKNQEGVVGMITAHGYIDNPTFRGMRWHLRNSFDSIYVLDLHGNSNKKEISPDGTKDENVFDIKTGVSIILGIKKQRDLKSKKLAQVYQADFYGTRRSKYERLDAENIETVKWNVLPEDTETWRIEGGGKNEYLKGFSVAELFPKNTTGILTMGDSFIVDENKNELSRRLDRFLESDISEDELKEKYDLGKNYAKWIIENKKKIENDSNKLITISYRPFDNRYTYFDNSLVWRTRTEVMQHIVNKENLVLDICRQVVGDSWEHVLIARNAVDDSYVSNRSKERGYALPLYLYTAQGERKPNIDNAIWKKINDVAGETTPEDILDYVYAYLHSPVYRNKYKEFLKSNFPRVPPPNSRSQFWNLVPLGKKLRELHLLTSSLVTRVVTTYPISGSNEVEKITYTNRNVYINQAQYFGNVPEIAWEFRVGGYQPAQKYLKDRKGKVLTDHDIRQWQEMIVSLVETDKIMQEIDIIISA
jgi:predicted helicase